MNVLRTKQVSHVGSRDDHGQLIAGDNDQKCGNGLAVGRQAYCDVAVLGPLYIQVMVWSTPAGRIQLSHLLAG